MTLRYPRAFVGFGLLTLCAAILPLSFRARIEALNDQIIDWAAGGV